VFPIPSVIFLLYAKEKNGSIPELASAKIEVEPVGAIQVTAYISYTFFL